MAEVFGFRYRNRVLALASVFAVSLLALPVRAELFVYEPFDYPAGEDLLGKNGGTGFTGTWRMGTAAIPANSAVIQAGSMTYSWFADVRKQRADVGRRRQLGNLSKLQQHRGCRRYDDVDQLHRSAAGARSRPRRGSRESLSARREHQLL